MTDHQQPPNNATPWEKRTKRLHNRAVLETMETLGFDVSDITETQKDMAFLRSLRRATGAGGNKLALGLLTLLITAASAGLTLLLQRLFGSPQ